MSLKNVAGWVVAAFLIWWVIEQPSAAAHVVHNIGHFLSTVAAGISNFFSQL